MSLEELLRNEEFERVQNLFSQDEQLQQNPGWKRGFVVSLIRSDKFNDAVQFCAGEVQTAPPELQTFLLFCWSYALYRLKQYDQALEILKGSPDKNDLSVMVLKTQLYYRKEERIECAKVFDGIFKQHPELKRNPEVLTNYIASLPVGIDSPDEGTLSRRATQSSSYESLYNLGCQLVFAGRFMDAEKVLLNALDLAVETLSNSGNFSLDEVKQEASIIKGQLAYVYFCTGRDTNAIEVLEGIKTFYDPSTELVCKSNLKCSEGLRPLFPSDNQLEILSTSQRKKILLNLCYRRKSSMLMKKFIDSFPEEQESFGFRAVLFFRRNDFANAFDCVQKAPLTESMFSLLYFNLLIRFEKYNEAREVFRQHSDSTAFLFALLDSMDKNLILKELAAFSLSLKDEKSILSIVDRLFKEQKYQPLVELLDLMPVAKLNHELQAYAVLSADAMGKPRNLQTSEYSGINYSQLLLTKTAKHRKSHSKNPKPKRETLRIDPERWLPKSQRASTKKSKKKSRQ